MSAVVLAFQQPVRDGALSNRIPQLFHTIIALDDDDPQVKAAESELRQLYTTRGLLTIDDVGDEASYQFVLLLCSSGPMNARSRVLQAAKAAGAKRTIPGDAVAFCTARIRLDELKAKASRLPPSAPALAENIGNLFAKDQAARQPQGFDRDRMIAADKALEAPLAEILNRYGVPTYAMVGIDAASQFVTMIQHQPPEFRRRVLPTLKANVDAGQADAGSYAMVYDRSQRDEGRNQLYGSHLECSDARPDLREAPIDDEARVNERRARLGLMRMELYARLVVEMSPQMCRK